MPEFTLYMAPASAPCRAVFLHHSLMGGSVPEIYAIPVDLDPRAPRVPDLLRHNPLHTVPTLVTPWGPLWESRTIMRFMESLSQEPVGYPIATFHRASVDRLLDWDLGTLFRCVSGIVYPKIFKDEDPEPRLLDELNETTRFLDQKQLGDGRAFLTGNTWTIADLSCHMTLSLLRLIDLEIDDIPRVAEWNTRMTDLPGWDFIDEPFRAWISAIQKTPQAPEAPAEEARDDTPEPEVPPAEDAPAEAAPDAGDDDPEESAQKPK